MMAESAPRAKAVSPGVVIVEIVWSIILVTCGGSVIWFRKPFAKWLANSYPQDSREIFEVFGTLSLIPVGLFFIGVGLYLFLTALGIHVFGK